MPEGDALNRRYILIDQSDEKTARKKLRIAQVREAGDQECIAVRFMVPVSSEKDEKVFKWPDDLDLGSVNRPAIVKVLKDPKPLARSRYRFQLL